MKAPCPDMGLTEAQIAETTGLPLKEVRRTLAEMKLEGTVADAVDEVSGARVWYRTEDLPATKTEAH